MTGMEEVKGGRGEKDREKMGQVVPGLLGHSGWQLAPLWVRF